MDSFGSKAILARRNPTGKKNAPIIPAAGHDRSKAKVYAHSSGRYQRGAEYWATKSVKQTQTQQASQATERLLRRHSQRKMEPKMITEARIPAIGNSTSNIAGRRKTVGPKSGERPS